VLAAAWRTGAERESSAIAGNADDALLALDDGITRCAHCGLRLDTAGQRWRYRLITGKFFVEECSEKVTEICE
jgi:hypothetical protein